MRKQKPNSICHCGSQKKYKKCHQALDEGWAQKRDIFGKISYIKPEKPEKIEMTAEEKLSNAFINIK